MSKTSLTYRDYEALPNDGRRYEIHDGELSVTPAPSLEHQIIGSRLYLQLAKWLEAHPGGILSDKPEETSIVQPDLLYVAPDRMGQASRRGIEGGPSLAVEILSPSTRQIDRATKTRLYARYGVPYLWLVDPDARTIEALRPGPGRDGQSGRRSPALLRTGSRPRSALADDHGRLDRPPCQAIRRSRRRASNDMEYVQRKYTTAMKR